MVFLHPQRIVYLVAVVFAVFETLVRASYYLDDTDSSIVYMPVGGWYLDNDATALRLESTKLYNSTFAYARCRAETGCTLTISFQGSGITLYGPVLGYGLSFNVSIDRGSPTYHRFDPAEFPFQVPEYNSTLYDITSLPIGNHALLLTLLDSSVNHNNATPGPSLIYFDFALVNRPSSADVHPSTTSVGNASTKPPSRSTTLGLAIGGTVGGIIIISIAIFILFCMRRRTRRGDTIVIESDANILVSNVDHIPTIVGVGHRPSPTDTPGFLPNPPHTPASPNPHIPHSSSTAPSTSPLPASTLQSGRANDAILAAAQGPSFASDSVLAAEEARFLCRLYERNAPAHEIAELMQAMRARQDHDSRMVASSRHTEREVALDGRG